MKIIGIALIVLGVLGLIYGGFSYNRERTVLEIGDMKATATERKTIPISPVLGIVALGIGVTLLVRSRRGLVSV